MEFGKKFFGYVKYYNKARGFGFIKWEGGDDLFFHVSRMRDDIDPEKGGKVRFYILVGKESKMAGEIELLND